MGAQARATHERGTRARTARCAAAGIAIAVLCSRAASAQLSDASLARFLLDSVRLDSAQLASAQAGHAVAKLLPTKVSRDVAVFGLIALHATREAYMARVGDGQQDVVGQARRFGIIGTPATPADVQGVSVDESEYRDLRACRVNDCKFKMPAAFMQVFADSVDWASPAAHAAVDSITRAQLLRLVAAYRATGNAAMLRYDDTHGVEASDAFAAMLAQSPYLRACAPALLDYLVGYPANRPEGMRDVLYWSEERLPHLAPTLTLNHMAVFTTASGTPIVARKQVYANHYYESALEVLAVVDAPALPGGPGIYLVAVRRYRFDNLPGGFFLNIRGRVRDTLMKRMVADLERERAASQSVAGR